MTDDLIDLLAADLALAEYSSAAIVALLGEPADRARQAGTVLPAQRVLRRQPASPLATLIRLFLLGERVPATRIDEALPSVGSAGLVALELASFTDSAAENGELQAIKSLNAVTVSDPLDEHSEAGAGLGDRDWWIVSDLDDHLRGGPASSDHVMGVGGATRSLIAQLPPTSVHGAVLDLGTGCGIVALHLALRGTQVVATDISERALSLGRLNARLNGLADRIEFRAGSLFEPVAGEEFALIASNPPFVITPRVTGEPVYEYRDGGRAGDDLAADVVREGARHLAHEGVLLCLANWESPWGQNGLERVRGWIAEAQRPGLAAWVIERDRLDPLGYAQMWARDGGERPGSAGFDRKLAAWLDDFEARRVVSIGLGSIRIARTRSSAPAPLVHLEQAAGAIAAEQTGRAFAAAFAAGVSAARMSDSEILDATWVRNSEVVEHREHQPGVEAPNAIWLTIERPIARRVAADPLLAAALGACDGELTLVQIADALATLLEVDEDASRQALIASVRELAWLGMVAAQG